MQRYFFSTPCRKVTWTHQKSDPASVRLHVQKHQFIHILIMALCGCDNLLQH